MTAVISVAQIVSAFRQIIGWPYVSPGSNNQNGIDCSGAFVYAYQKYGYSIYHGSNRIIREFCKNPITVTSASQLKAGMAVLKSRTDLSQLGAQYKPGGKYYNANLPYDYYHIGLVASVNPLQIIHATTPAAKMDTTLGKWSTAGYLNAVDYSADAPAPGTDSPPDTGSTPGIGGSAVTVAASGSTVNLRKEPSQAGAVLVRVPLGQRVQVLSEINDVWWQVKYQNVTGYMMREFLKADDGSPSVQPAPTADTAITVAPSGSTVNLRREPSQGSAVLVRVPLGQTVKVLSKTNDAWWQVQYQDKTGYMMQKFLKV